MKTVIAFLFVFLAIVGLGLLLAFPVMWAVNYVFAPTFLFKVFGVVQLDFLRTWLLIAICGTLFKSTASSN